MSDRIKNLGLKARKLPLAERAELIDDLLASLDEPDPRIDALWTEEAERRLALSTAGKCRLTTPRTLSQSFAKGRAGERMA